MGQQQFLLIVLSVIIVGISVSVGVVIFQAQAEQSNIDSIISNLANLGTTAYAYRMRPVSLGGGGGTYNNFHAFFNSLPQAMRQNTDGIFYCEADYISDYGGYVAIKGVSAQYPDVERWVLVTPSGEITSYLPAGETADGDEDTGGDDNTGDEDGEGSGRPGWAGGGPPPWARRP